MPSKYALPPGTQLDVRFLPVIQNLTALGLSELDIGIILGYGGRDPGKWINNLKLHHEDIKEAASRGKKMALAQLCSAMFKAAQGYNYVETREEDGPKGHTDGKYKKHIAPNAQLAMFLATNLMPDVFKNRTEVDKREIKFVVNGKAEEDKISRLMGLLGVQAKEAQDAVTVNQCGSVPPSDPDGA